MFFPLISVPDELSLSAYDMIAERAFVISEAIMEIGKGIGSIFLLIVLFVYISSILDGGKFQIKMLVPLLIYVCVCNFNIVAKPMMSFATTIQKGCVEKAKIAKADLIQNIATNKNNTIIENALDHGGNAKPKTNDSVGNQLLSDATGQTPTALSEASGDVGVGVLSNDAQEEKKRKGWLADISQGITNWYNSNIRDRFWSMFGPNGPTYSHLGFPGLVVLLIEWLTDILGFCITGLGAMMTGIVIAFGPITWAFAILPGQSKTITSWFLRICQFALYSPIVAVLQAFACALIGSTLGDKVNNVNEFFGGTLFLASVMMALLSALMAVPTVASMIIEGAVGSLTLSGGLMTATNIWSNLTTMGERGRDQKQEEILRNIASNTSGGGGSAAGGGGTAAGSGSGTGMSGGTR